MNWKVIENELLKDMEYFTKKVKELAPKNSSYKSNFNGKLVDFIFVDNKKVKTNTNRLYESITFDYKTLGGKNIVAQTVVRGDVPHYDKAVLSKVIHYARHYGRTEYGNVRYPNSVEHTKPNRNYLYYMKGEKYMQMVVNKWNGQTLKVRDKIGDFK